MIDSLIIKHLFCPCCRADVKTENDGSTLVCLGQRKHSFDFSSKGHVNLALMQGVTGDSKDAVRSRSEFLDAGYYRPIADKLCEILRKYKNEGLVIDAGCGEGYYTARIADEGYLTAGFDLSKFAVMSTASRLKCKTDERNFAAVASVFELPVKDKTADAVVSIFAPCVENEFARVLADEGILVVVSAGEEHLMGLKRALYKEVYKNDERADMPRQMSLSSRERLKYTVTVEGQKNIQNLFSMTPYYWRTSREDAKKLEGLSSLTTEIDILFSIYKKEC